MIDNTKTPEPDTKEPEKAPELQPGLATGTTDGMEPGNTFPLVPTFGE